MDSVFQQAVGNGRRGLRGFFVNEASGDLIEMVAYRGIDFVVLDGEHGTVWPALPWLLRTAQGAGLAAMVRVGRRRPEQIGQALDLGADAVLVPGVEEVEEVREAVAAAYYAPVGRRGVAFLTRAARYELDTGPAALEDLNRRVVLLVQIETRPAWEQLDAILAVQGCAGVFVGPADLSVALGHGSAYTPEVAGAIERVAERAEIHRKPWGLFTATADLHAYWRRRGAYFCTTGLGNVLDGGLRAWLAAAAPPG